MKSKTKNDYIDLLMKASQIKGTLTGALKAIITWKNITDKQKEILATMLEENEKINLVE